MKVRRDIGGGIKARRDIKTSFINALLSFQNKRGQQVFLSMGDRAAQAVVFQDGMPSQHAIVL